MSWDRGVKRPKPPLRGGWFRQTTHTQRQEMAKKYLEGASMAAIGREFGVSGDTVKRCLTDMGVELRPDPKRGRPARNQWKTREG